MNLRILSNIELPSTATDSQTSTVGEPSVANINDQVLITGNWYASRSLNNGSSWTYISPYSFFPSAAGGFCCDQTVLHDPRNGLTFWLLQYVKQGGSNVLRLAVKNTGTGLDVEDWVWWDLIPTNVNSQWQNEWFDYNHAALSDSFFYVVTNVFTTANNKFTRSVVFRFPLQELVAGTGLTFDFFETKSFSLRCTQGATNIMYFGSHQRDFNIRLFSWPEDDATASFEDIAVTPWVGVSGYSAAGPDGSNWLSRCDPRITGGWIANGIIGFMWSVDRTTARPFPHVRVARFREADLVLIDEPDIWGTSYAYAYPDAYPNVNGEVGITLFRGGGSIHPGHVIGFWNNASSAWVIQATRNGTDGPSDNKWGDYITCRRHSPGGAGWLASGFTLQGGNTRASIRPCVVHFDLH